MLASSAPEALPGRKIDAGKLFWMGSTLVIVVTHVAVVESLSLP